MGTTSTTEMRFSSSLVVRNVLKIELIQKEGREKN
jgi:hypothetical protein